MTSTWQQACEAFRKKMLEAFDEPDGYFDIRNIIRSLPLPVDPTPRKEVEPVAWKLLDEHGQTFQIIESPPAASDIAQFKIVALYAADTVPAAAPKVPVDINAFVDEYMKGIAGPPETISGLRYHVREAVAFVLLPASPSVNSARRGKEKGMPKFRKKPVVIEARRLAGDEWADIAKWCGGDIVTSRDCTDEYYSTLRIKTLEGEMFASEGDWIIRGVKDEFYPCKPDIFEATYEPA